MQEPCWVGGIRRRLCFVPRHLRFRSSGAVIPGHADFLFFRLGLGERPFPGKIEIPKERFSLHPDALAGQPERIRQKYESLQVVPVGLNLREHGLVGLVGGEGKQGAYEVAREILIQAAYGCSYTEVKLVLLYDASNPDEKAMFSLFRWLPIRGQGMDGYDLWRERQRKYQRLPVRWSGCCV